MRCGKRGERRRWREERPERSEAVYIFKAALTAAENIGHREPGQASKFSKQKRRRWREEGGARSAAVEKIEDQRKPEDFFGHRKPG